MGEYFSTKSYQAPVVYINILGVQLGLAEVKVHYDITSIDRPVTPKSLTTFPNLIVSLEVEKFIDGDVNKYILVLKYLPQDGEDPSYIDKLISANRTQNKSKITIAYGDGSTDGFFRAKQEAMIATYKMKVDLDTAAMTYTITAVSTSKSSDLNSRHGSSLITYEFADRRDTYPTVIIQEIYNNPIYGLKSLFPGGIYVDGIHLTNLDSSNRPDAQYKEAVITGGDLSPLEYLKSLVKAMYPANIATEKDAYSYVYSFDDTEGFQSFHIDKAVGRSRDSILDTVVIGAKDSPVISYEFATDYTYAIAVNYGSSTSIESHTRYYIDDNGKEYKEAVVGSTKNNNSESITVEKLWWNTISNIPFSMSMVVRSLKKPLPIMNNIYVRVLIKGQEHWISGVFYVIKIVDKVDKSGFVSEINLLKKAL